MFKLLQWGLVGLLVVVAFLVVYSQVFLPLIRGTPVFPFFRRRPVIEREVEAVNEEIREQEQRKKLAEQQRRLRKTQR